MSLDRSDSLESIPDVDFIARCIEDVHITPASPMNEISEFRQRELNGEMSPEPLLTEDKSRFVLFPIKYGDVSNSYYFPIELLI